MQRYCQVMAVRVSGRRSKKEPLTPRVKMPPVAGDPSVTSAERRLQALRVIDDLLGRLKSDPRHPEIHYRLGAVHLYSLDNPKAAVANLCRAVLEAPKERRYLLTLRAAWLRPGMEGELESSLSGSERALAWRTLLAETRRLTGVDEETRAAVYEDGLRAQVIAAGYRKIPRDRGQAPITELADVLADWADEDPKLWIVVSIPKKARARVAYLSNRDRADVSPALWLAVGRRGRMLVFARGAASITDTVALLQKSLKNVWLVLSLHSGRRQFHLEGRFIRDRKFELRFMAARPSTTVLDTPAAGH